MRRLVAAAILGGFVLVPLGTAQAHDCQRWVHIHQQPVGNLCLGPQN